MAAATESAEISLPSGLDLDVEHYRFATLSDPDDPFSLVTLVDCQRPLKIDPPAAIKIDPPPGVVVGIRDRWS